MKPQLPPILKMGAPREDQTVYVAHRIAEEQNADDEEVKKVVGIFAPNHGDSRLDETLTTQWCIVSQTVNVEFFYGKKR